MTTATVSNRTDVYTRVTNHIIQELEAGVRPWLKPWNAEHAAGRITRPLRFNSEPYSGINILMLWAEAEARSFACPIWMTFRQAKELGGHVRKGEHGTPVVYASKFSTTEADAWERGLGKRAVGERGRSRGGAGGYAASNAARIASRPTPSREDAKLRGWQ